MGEKGTYIVLSPGFGVISASLQPTHTPLGQCSQQQPWSVREKTAAGGVSNPGGILRGLQAQLPVLREGNVSEPWEGALTAGFLIPTSVLTW